MVNSLTKLGMAQGGSNLENRSLAIDLCSVMVLWEERRMKELESEAAHVVSQVCRFGTGISFVCERADMEGAAAVWLAALLLHQAYQACIRVQPALFSA